MEFDDDTPFPKEEEMLVIMSSPSLPRRLGQCYAYQEALAYDESQLFQKAVRCIDVYRAYAMEEVDITLNQQVPWAAELEQSILVMVYDFHPHFYREVGWDRYILTPRSVLGDAFTFCARRLEGKNHA